jgi:hypothetical protein
LILEAAEVEARDSGLSAMDLGDTGAAYYNDYHYPRRPNESLRGFEYGQLGREYKRKDATDSTNSHGWFVPIREIGGVLADAFFFSRRTSPIGISPHPLLPAADYQFPYRISCNAHTESLK